MKNGIALLQLPERFQSKEHSATLTEYIGAKYSSYGFRKGKPIVYNPQSKENNYRWVENISDGLRKAGDAHDIIKLNHTGWYADNFQDEEVHGEVYQLPARNGLCVYVPAVNDPSNEDAALVDFTYAVDDKDAAARRADSMAEWHARDSREWQAKDAAENRIADIQQEITDIYKSFRQMVRDIRANRDKLQGVAVVKQLIESEWRRTKERIHKLRAERQRIEKYGIEY